MKIAYFDCFAGAAGDMILGALIDAGLDAGRLAAELRKLNLDGYEFRVVSAVRRGIGGTQVQVEVNEAVHRHHHRRLSDVRTMIDGSGLAPAVKQRSMAVFERLAAAEATVHRISSDEVHFHEVGAVDAIVDVVGCVSGLEMLGIENVFCSPLHLGGGTVECAHGILPVPAPATAELVKGVPVYSRGPDGELLTPTGAALLTTLAAGFGPMPAMRTDAVGYGAGAADPAIPNLLRVFIGETASAEDGYLAEQVAVIETAVDDMDPQIWGHAVDTLIGMGAFDVFLTPVQMKKNRPGTLATVVCRPEDAQAFADTLLRETTSIGVRWRTENRVIARRSIEECDTPLGTVRCKIAFRRDERINVKPEYDDCLRIARDKKIPLKTVMEIVKRCSSLFCQQKR